MSRDGRHDNAAWPERDERLADEFSRLETPEHTEGFFGRLETRLSAVDAERRAAADTGADGTRVITRRRWSWQRWAAAGTAVAATAAAVSIAFVAINRAGGPSAVSVAGSSARSTLAAPQASVAPESGNDAALKSAPGSGAPGPSAGSVGGGRYAPPQAQSTVGHPMTIAEMIAAHSTPPEQRISAAEAAAALGGRLRLPPASLVGKPVAYFTYAAPWRTKPEVSIVFSDGFQLTSSAGRDITVYFDPIDPSDTVSLRDSRHPEGRSGESLRPPDYAALVAERAEGNSHRPELVSIAGRDGMLEFGYSRATGPYLGSLVWYDGQLFQHLLYFGVPRTRSAGVALQQRMIAAGESIAR
jgi:hypothetical protein